jgi:hypothetical protein
MSLKKLARNWVLTGFAAEMREDELFTGKLDAGVVDDIDGQAVLAAIADEANAALGEPTDRPGVEGDKAPEEPAQVEDAPNEAAQTEPPAKRKFTFAPAAGARTAPPPCRSSIC